MFEQSNIWIHPIECGLAQIVLRLVECLHSWPEICFCIMISKNLRLKLLVYIIRIIFFLLIDVHLVNVRWLYDLNLIVLFVHCLEEIVRHLVCLKISALLIYDHGWIRMWLRKGIFGRRAITLSLFLGLLGEYVGFHRFVVLDDVWVLRASLIALFGIIHVHFANASDRCQSLELICIRTEGAPHINLTLAVFLQIIELFLIQLLKSLVYWRSLGVSSLAPAEPQRFIFITKVLQIAWMTLWEPMLRRRRCPAEKLVLEYGVRAPPPLQQWLRWAILGRGGLPQGRLRNTEKQIALIGSRNLRLILHLQRLNVCTWPATLALHHDLLEEGIIWPKRPHILAVHLKDLAFDSIWSLKLRVLVRRAWFHSLWLHWGLNVRAGIWYWSVG